MESAWHTEGVTEEDDMRVRHLDHLNLTVSSLAATRDFYSRVFGFEEVERGEDADGPWGILRSGDAMLCVYERPALERHDRATLTRMGLHRISHFALRIEDEAAWRRTLAREGLELLYGGEVRWPHSTAWYVRDPTGYEIEVALWKGDRIEFGR